MIEIQINGIDEIIKTLKLLASKTENNASLMRNIAGTMEFDIRTIYI